MNLGSRVLRFPSDRLQKHIFPLVKYGKGLSLNISFILWGPCQGGVIPIEPSFFVTTQFSLFHYHATCKHPYPHTLLSISHTSRHIFHITSPNSFHLEHKHGCTNPNKFHLFTYSLFTFHLFTFYFSLLPFHLHFLILSFIISHYPLNFTSITYII